MLKNLPAITAIATLLALTPPALAGGGINDLVQLEILDGGKTPRGTHQAALRLILAEGWQTYWRAPGDTGIPPRFNWRGSRNMGAVAITWPTPGVFDKNGLRTIGYEKQLVLPIEITPSKPGAPVRLRGTMEFGLCKDICIPGKLKFDQVLDADAGRNPAIAAALAQRPFSESEAGVRKATCRLTPNGKDMRIEARITMPASGGREVVIIEPGNPEIWVSQSATSRSGNVLSATSELVHSSGQPYALDRSQIRITVLGKRHAVDIRGCAPG